MLPVTDVPARTRTGSEGAKTFEAELKSYDSATGAVDVTKPNGTAMRFNRDKLSTADIPFLAGQGNTDEFSAFPPVLKILMGRTGLNNFSIEGHLRPKRREATPAFS